MARVEAHRLRVVELVVRDEARNEVVRGALIFVGVAFLKLLQAAHDPRGVLDEAHHTRVVPVQAVEHALRGDQAPRGVDEAGPVDPRLRLEEAHDLRLALADGGLSDVPPRAPGHHDAR